MLGSHAPRSGEKLSGSCGARSAHEGKIVRKHENQAQHQAGRAASAICRYPERQPNKRKSKTREGQSQAADGTLSSPGALPSRHARGSHRSRVGVSVTGGSGGMSGAGRSMEIGVYRKAENLVAVGQLARIVSRPDAGSSNRQTMCRLLLNSENCRL